MRKLIYVGTNGIDTVKTGSYSKMNELKAQGFSFIEEMEEVKEPWSNKRAKKLEEIARAKKGE